MKNQQEETVKKAAGFISLNKGIPPLKKRGFLFVVLI